MTAHMPSARVGTRPPKALPILAIQIVLSTLVAAAFVGIYLGLQRDPVPHDIRLVTTRRPRPRGAAAPR